MPLLAEKIRPETLEQVRGNARLKAYLKAKLSDPAYDRDVLFLVGEAGTGKTSVARILGKILAGDGMNIREINIAGERGIDSIKDIQEDVWVSPWPSEEGTGWKVYILDEADNMTAAARPLLKHLLENLPKNRMVILTANTDKPFKDRAYQRRMKVFEFGGVADKEIIKFLKDANKKEKFGLSSSELKSIAARSGGSVGQAATYLEEAAALKSVGYTEPAVPPKSAKKKTLRKLPSGVTKGRRKVAKKSKAKKRTTRKKARKTRKAPARKKTTKKVGYEKVGTVKSIILGGSSSKAPKRISMGGMTLWIPKNGGSHALIRGLKSEKD